MLQPKRNIHRQQKGRNRGLAQTGNAVAFGDLGLQATSWGHVTARQIEAARRVIARHTKRQGQIWIRIFPDKPITQKALGVRQGSGKGSIDHWVAVIQPGMVMFEVEGVDANIAREAFRLAAAKLSVSSQVIERTVM